MEYDGVLELVKKRRTIRRFKLDSIPDLFKVYDMLALGYPQRSRDRSC